jgi:hypothetical protein
LRVTSLGELPIPRLTILIFVQLHNACSGAAWNTFAHPLRLTRLTRLTRLNGPNTGLSMSLASTYTFLELNWRFLNRAYSGI